MMRPALPLATVVLAAAAPLGAAETTAFVRQCALKAAPATCACLAGQLQTSRDGQVVLDTYEAATLAAADRQAAQTAMLQRHGITEADLGPIGNAIPALLAAAREACR